MNKANDGKGWLLIADIDEHFRFHGYISLQHILCMLSSIGLGIGTWLVMPRYRRCEEHSILSVTADEAARDHL
jgi:hypothetical protein